MPNGDDHREPTLGEMAIRAEDLIDRLEKENRSLRDQLNASQNQIKQLIGVVDRDHVFPEIEHHKGFAHRVKIKPASLLALSQSH